MLSAIPNFSQARIIVIGDAMLDRYWSGTAARISPEAPVPVVRVNTIEDRVGGAANVALNIAKLGGKVTLLGVIGDDVEGDSLTRLLVPEGVSCDFLIEKSLPSICKLRIMAQHQQLIRVDFEQSPLKFDNNALLNKLLAHLGHHEVIVFSDYGKGTLAEVPSYIKAAKRAGLMVLVDPKGSDYARYRLADIITPNLHELQAVVGDCSTVSQLQDKGLQLLAQYGINNLLCTRGEAGMTLIADGELHSLPAQAKEVFDVTGAGDTVIAVMALSLAINKSMTEAMYLANLAAGIVVGKVGTSTVSMLELTRAMHGDRDSLYGVVTEEQLAVLIAAATAHGERVVITHGFFNVLNAEYVTYLQQAKALGDRLIIAVNSDARQCKTESTPGYGLQERMTVLAALACVDWVVAVNEKTPERLYGRLLPDVIVKSIECGSENTESEENNHD